MCYADTENHDNGTATAFCYCGWSHECADSDAADRAATDHERDAFDHEHAAA